MSPNSQQLHCNALGIEYPYRKSKLSTGQQDSDTGLLISMNELPGNIFQLGTLTAFLGISGVLVYSIQCIEIGHL